MIHWDLSSGISIVTLGISGYYDSPTQLAQTFYFPSYVDPISSGEIIATESYANKRASILPISSVASNTIALGTTKTVYRVTDSSGTGAFPTITAPTGIVQDGDYYYCFEIEWKTSSSAASFSEQYDWINYPEMQSDGQQHTYCITGRWDSGGSGASAFTLNCWRVK